MIFFLAPFVFVFFLLLDGIPVMQGIVFNCLSNLIYSKNLLYAQV
jgi:hypothetical protein